MTELLDGRYRLVEQLGRGGSSTVWRGYDERLSRPVAVKILNDPQAHWVRDEAKTLALLAHPHTAIVFDVGEQYLVTELVDGRSLTAVLDTGPLPWTAAVDIAAQIASALAAAHSRGLVHRDVTPSNIMLTPAGAKLIDFGISAFAGDSEADPDGRIRGTPPYAAPERLTQSHVSPAVDLYGLGVVLYQALTGYFPGPDTSLGLVQGLPEPVARACLSCLAHDPAGRPVASELADVLRAAAPVGAARAYAVGAATVPPSMTRPLPTMTQLVSRRQWQSVRPRWLVAGLTLALVGGLAGLALGVGLATNPTQPQAAAGTLAGAACSVNYQLTSVDGNRFEADIVATNTGQPLPTGWRLTMQLPGQVDGLRPSGDWSVDGNTVTSPAQSPLEAGRSVQLTLTARQSNDTVLPTAFDLGGRTCAANLSGPDGAPLAPGATVVSTQPSQGNDNGNGKGHGHGGGDGGSGGDGPG